MSFSLSSASTSPAINQKWTSYASSISTEKSLLIMDGKLHIRLAVKDILYAQAEHIYARIYCRNQQRILQRISLSAFLDQLPADQFMQVHRSYLVNLDRVDAWTGDLLSIDGVKIPISRKRRKDVIQRLEAR